MQFGGADFPIPDYAWQPSVIDCMVAATRRITQVARPTNLWCDAR